MIMQGLFISDAISTRRQQRFQMDTNWIVISGAPCSGKTTLLKELSMRGRVCTNEVAREYLESKGSAIRSNEAAFQRRVLELKAGLEMGLPTDVEFFLDRGIPDTITYFRVAGINPIRAAKYCFARRYKKVILLERLPLENDGIRNEDEDKADFIHEWLARDYNALGYDVNRIPIANTSDRADMVLRLIGEKGC